MKASRIRTISVIAVAVFGIVFALPNLLSQEFLNRLPDWVPVSRVSLGLDLQGGAHLLLEVDRADVTRIKARQLRDDVRGALRNERIGYNQLQVGGTSVSVTIRDPDNFKLATSILGKLSVSGSETADGSDESVLVQQLENGRFELEISEVEVNVSVRRAVSQSIEVLRRRIDQLGTTEPLIQRQGANRIVVQVPGLNDPELLKRILGTTARLEFRAVDETASPTQARATRAPLGSEVLPDYKNPDIFHVIKIRTVVLGEELLTARSGQDGRSGEPVVLFSLNPTGAKKFALFSQNNVGRKFAIVLDGEVVSAPVIRSPILDGSGMISGGFTFETTEELSILLRAGALPAKLVIKEERTVGPSLGADSVAAGKWAALIGTALVIAFMIFIYRIFGVFATIALLLNLTLIVAALSIIGATLTLPGIAGVILTVGMAVDSNVLIFERIREEASQLPSVYAAVESGFSRALATIFDANITTLIAALVLFALGSGPVRGFAVTLCIGIATTLISAYSFTRLMVLFWATRKRQTHLPI